MYSDELDIHDLCWKFIYILGVLSFSHLIFKYGDKYLSNKTYPKHRSNKKHLNKTDIDYIKNCREPVIMKCKKHNYTYNIGDGKCSRIKDGEVIEGCSEVDFITVDNCENYTPYLEQTEPISMDKAIEELNKATKKICSFYIKKK